MRILLYLNISNADDIEADSGIIFARLVAKELSENGDTVGVVGPPSGQPVFERIPTLSYYPLVVPSSKYGVRFHFDWFAVGLICEQFAPDIVLVNQIELCSHFRSLLGSGECGTLIIGYCHYIPVGRDRNTPSLTSYDEAFDADGLGAVIQVACVQGAAAADVVFVQSSFARNALLGLASRYGLDKEVEVCIAPPPVDPLFSRSHSNPPPTRTIIYNHRLYKHYGTWEFLALVGQIKEATECDLLVCDPMPNRSAERNQLDPSVVQVRRHISLHQLGTIVPGADRAAYRRSLEGARLGFSSFQGNCVWSMSVADLLGMGVPVVAPHHAAFPEMVPEACLFTSLSEAKSIARQLLDDDDFWRSVSEEALHKSSHWTTARFRESFSTEIKRYLPRHSCSRPDGLGQAPAFRRAVPSDCGV